MHQSYEKGLRERKKAATRSAIEQAAVEIASEQGYEAATAEAIAAQAGVSLRTFFNYFPSKDTAIIGKGLLPIDESQAEAILDGSRPDLLKGIARIAEACAARANPLPHLVRSRRRLIIQSPTLFHAHVIAEAEFDVWLCRVVSDHLLTHPSRRRLSKEVTVEEEARLAVTMVSSAVHFHLRRAVQSDVDILFSQTDIERTIDLMAEIYGKEA